MKVSKIVWGLVIPLAVLGDVVVFLCSIISIFDGGGDIGCVGFTEGVLARMSGKPLPTPKVKLPEYVSKAPAKAGTTGFDWVRLLVWGGLLVLLGFAAFVFTR